MANLSEMIKAKSTQDQAWLEERRAERGNLSAMRDAVLEAITTNPEMYQKYLALQADNIQYSVGNIALVMVQLDNPTRIGTTDYWHNLGRTVTNEAMQHGAKVFVPPRNQRRGYVLGSCYDVSQPVGKPLPDIQPLAPDTERMTTALATLMNYSPVPIVEDNSMEAPVYYDPEKMQLAINTTCDDETVFAAMTTEICYARIHDKGRNTDFDRDAYRLDAESMGYLICHRFGVEQEMPVTEGVAALYEGYNPSNRGEALEQIRKTARNIGDGIDRAIQPRQQERSRRHAAAR